MKKLLFSITLLALLTGTSFAKELTCSSTDEKTPFASVKLTTGKTMKINYEMKEEFAYTGSMQGVAFIKRSQDGLFDYQGRYYYEDYADGVFTVSYDDNSYTIFSHFVSDGPVTNSFYRCR